MVYSISITLFCHTQSCFSSDGSTGQCCGCKRPPISCVGKLRCEVTFKAGEEEVCVWVKVDRDNSNENREVTLTTSDNQSTANVTVKNSPGGEFGYNLKTDCFKVSTYICINSSRP